MTDKTDHFKKELDIFGSEVGIAAQNFHSFLELSRLAKRKRVYSALNSKAAFWNIHTHAVQLTFFIVLGRIFDTGKDVHGWSRLLKVTEDNLHVFSKEEFEKREISKNGNAEWIEGRTRECIPITNKRLMQIRKYIARYHKQYRSFENIRHQYYAHKICVDKLEQKKLFSAAQIGKIEKIIQALANAHDVLWQCYENGRPRRLNQPNNFWKNHAIKDTRKMVLDYAGLKKWP